VPQSKGAIVRCALESIALKYRWVLERCEEMLGHRLEPLHIVGGGTRNRLLSQLAADALGRRVITGPIEATATGNIVVQAMALGDLASLEEGREVVRNSFELTSFEPTNQSGWDDAYACLLTLIKEASL
jgi:rhamnulokinase